MIGAPLSIFHHHRRHGAPTPPRSSGLSPTQSQHSEPRRHHGESLLSERPSNTATAAQSLTVAAGLLACIFPLVAANLRRTVAAPRQAAVPSRVEVDISSVARPDHRDPLA